MLERILPSTTTQNARIDRSVVLKGGVIASAPLVLGGFAGSWAVSVAATVPAWEQTLFLDAEILGVPGLLFVPLIVGVVLPLVE
ncbi:MAG: hypothetical protein ABEJ44_07525 [Halanaeroarchaeum sp.]